MEMKHKMGGKRESGGKARTIVLGCGNSVGDVRQRRFTRMVHEGTCNGVLDNHEDEGD